MARILSRSGPWLTAMPLADRESAGTRLIRGEWLSVRMEVSHYDPILKDEFRVPVADADCVFDGDRFRVIDVRQGDSAGRAIQYHLSRLADDERIALMRDLVAV